MSLIKDAPFGHLKMGDMSMSQQISFNQVSSSSSFLSGLVANTYRYAGVGLAIITPIMLRIADLSLQSTYRFSEARYWLFHPAGKVFVIASAVFCYYYSLVSLYVSLTNSYMISTRRVTSSFVMLLLTACFGAGVGYWFW